MLLIDNRILIVHMRKCGGTSFCTGLIHQLPAERIFFLGYTREGEKRSAEARRGKAKLWKHATTATILKGLDLKRRDLEIHLVALRPWWERVASFYFHARRYHEMDSRKYRWVVGMNFSDYLRSPHVNLDRLDEYACNANGRTIVDHFIRFDSLDQSYSALCERLGLGAQPLPHLNANELKEQALGGSDLRSIYSDDDWSLAQDLFKPETDYMTTMGLRY